MSYTDPIIQKYIDIIKSKNGEIKYFYQGEPTRIPTSVLPCCIVSKAETQVGFLTNSEDEHQIAMKIIIVTDIRKELSTNENDSKVIEGVSKLYDILEGRNADYTLKDTSILDILRVNQLLDAGNNLRTDLSTVTKVGYGETLQNRDPAEWRIQAEVEFVAHFTQIR